MATALKFHTLTSFTCMYAACNVDNAETYQAGCLVSTCNTGWRVSSDKAQCLANDCSCENGKEATGAKCVTHRSTTCESCNTGFKLDSRTPSCAGTVFLSRCDDECYFPSHVDTNFPRLLYALSLVMVCICPLQRVMS